MPGFEVRVVDKNFKDETRGDGLMIVKGPNGCRYLDDLEKQKAYIQEGWNKSGDLCRIDEDGYFYYEARTDDTVLTGGYNVSGLEIEAVLLNTKVREAAVVGTPDKDRGQIVKAFIILKEKGQFDDDSVTELQDFVKSQNMPSNIHEQWNLLTNYPYCNRQNTTRCTCQIERERAKEAGII